MPISDLNLQTGSRQTPYSPTPLQTRVLIPYGEPNTYYAAKLRGCEYGETPDEYSAMPQGGELSVTNTNLRSWTARFQLDWSHYFNEVHSFSGGVGIEASSDGYKGYSNTTRGYFPDRGMSFAQGIDLTKYTNYASWLADNVPSITDSKSNVLSAYITASYDWRRLIFLNANARVDGSNSFGDRANDKAPSDMVSLGII